jgi:long-chain acyl-CoA synthetase
MNIARLALDNIDRYGEYASTWFEGRVFTNVENYQSACRMAAVLQAHGVKPGDRVVVMTLNSPEVMWAFTAVWKSCRATARIQACPERLRIRAQGESQRALGCLI